MDISVRSIVEDDIPGLMTTFESWMAPTVQCAVGSFWPSPVEIRSYAVRLVAERGGELVGAALATSTGHIGWLLTKPGVTRESFDSLTEEVLAATGDCWGQVLNDDLRAEYLAGCDAVYLVTPESDPTMIRRS